MKNILTFVKDVNEFGKKLLSSDLFQYEHYSTRVYKGDLLIYFYPENNSLGIYEAQEETNSFVRDDLKWYEGKMIHLNHTCTPIECLNKIKAKDSQIGNELEKIIIKLVEKNKITK